MATGCRVAVPTTVGGLIVAAAPTAIRIATAVRRGNILTAAARLVWREWQRRATQENFSYAELRYIRNGPDWQITPRRPMRGRLKTGLLSGSFCNNESAWMVLGKESSRNGISLLRIFDPGDDLNWPPSTSADPDPAIFGTQLGRTGLRDSPRPCRSSWSATIRSSTSCAE